MTEIRGKAVVLREKRLEDAWNDYTWKKDAELARLDASIPLDIPFPIYLLGYAEELNRADTGGYTLAIETTDGRHIGNCSYYHVDRGKRETELGIIIGDQSCWDEGYGTDAVAALVDYLFKVERFDRVYLHTLVGNSRAQKCFRKCGFVPVKRVFRGGYDFILMQITRPVPAPHEGSSEASRHA
jgi:RimJ/RimL family protein N-acetyltransferase